MHNGIVVIMSDPHWSFAGSIETNKAPTSLLSELSKGRCSPSYSSTMSQLTLGACKYYVCADYGQHPPSAFPPPNPYVHLICLKEEPDPSVNPPAEVIFAPPPVPLNPNLFAGSH